MFVPAKNKYLTINRTFALIYARSQQQQKILQHRQVHYIIKPLSDCHLVSEKLQTFDDKDDDLILFHLAGTVSVSQCDKGDNIS